MRHTIPGASTSTSDRHRCCRRDFPPTSSSLLLSLLLPQPPRHNPCPLRRDSSHPPWCQFHGRLRLEPSTWKGVTCLCLPEIRKVYLHPNVTTRVLFRVGRTDRRKCRGFVVVNQLRFCQSQVVLDNRHTSRRPLSFCTKPRVEEGGWSCRNCRQTNKP